MQSVEVPLAMHPPHNGRFRGEAKERLLDLAIDERKLLAVGP